MTLSPMTRQDVPPLLTLSGAFLEAQSDRVGHITLSDRCKGQWAEKKRQNRHVSFWDTHHSRLQYGSSERQVPPTSCRPEVGLSIAA